MAIDLQGQAASLLTKVGDALESLLTLEIHTAITPMDIEKDNDGWSLKPKADAGAVEGIRTTIRLEQGDIHNAMTGNALQNAQLMELHARQVELSRQIVADNVKALVELARDLVR